MLAELRIQRHTAEDTARIVDALVDVYARVYDVPPYRGDPFFAVGAFRDRLLGAVEMSGFESVTAYAEGALVGLVHGVALADDRAWWQSLDDRRPAEMVTAVQAGQVGWLRELMVLPEHTGRGIGRRLHDEWINGRSQQRWTALTCIVDNQPAHDAYVRWGYGIIGRIKHAADSPVYDAMILPRISS